LYIFFAAFAARLLRQKTPRNDMLCFCQATLNKPCGRIETRILTTSEMLNSYSTWPGLAQVYRLERQLQWWRNGRCYRSSCQIEYGITSLSRQEACPARLLEIRRTHWGRIGA
jgi:hypothetical protein